MRKLSPNHIIRYLLETILYAELYVFGAELALYIASFSPKEPTPIWPPEGIFLALSLIIGLRTIPGAIIGASIANYMYYPEIFTAVTAGFGNALGTVVNYYIIKKWIKNDYPLDSGRSVGYFFTIATYPGALVASIVGVSALWFWDGISSERFFNVLLSWFICKELGFVIITPFILAVYNTRGQYTWSLRTTLLAIISISLMTGISRYAFISSEPILILPIPFLIYASVRFRDIGATSSVLLISGIAAYYTIRGYGPFANLEYKWKSVAPLIYLDSYIIALTGVSFTLVAVLKERERAQKAALDNMKQIEIMQENAKRELEQKVIERTKIIEEQKNELENQISMAQKIQLALLPQSIPKVSDLEISFQYLPMMKVGGDFLDIRKFPALNGVSFFICDVSGHGVPSAFLAAMVKMSLYHWYENPKLLKRAAKELYLSLEESMGPHFITASFLYYDLETRILGFARAGHLPLLVLRANGEMEQFSPKGKIIMSLAPPDCDEIQIQLEKGDTVILYTDGIIEARHPQTGEMYSTELLIDFIKENKAESIHGLARKIIELAIDYSGGLEKIEDDLSILCFRV
jgi:serine phosphatase RsbU (regulator of sigma subunit)